MNHSVWPRVRAACLRAPSARFGAVLAVSVALVTIACGSVPSLAAARARRPAAGRMHRCADAHVRIGRVTRRETDRAVVCLLNRQRRRHGLPLLRLSPRLDSSAQIWTNTMVRDHAFTHGSDFGARISRVGFDWSQAGENIADGYSTPVAAVRAWMRSTGHCQNILDPDYREVGIGFDGGSALGGAYRPGTWTTDFGLLMNQHPLSGNFGPAERCPY